MGKGLIVIEVKGLIGVEVAKAIEAVKMTSGVEVAGIGETIGEGIEE